MPKIIKPAKGTFTTADITIDSSGRVISAADGQAGGGDLVATATLTGPNSSTHVVTANTNFAAAVLYGAGGGGSGGNPNRPGNQGGGGGFGYFAGPISPGATLTYTLGAGGTTSTPTPSGSGAPAGNAGQASTLDGLLPGTITANGGNGGQQAATGQQRLPGNLGTVSPAGSYTMVKPSDLGSGSPNFPHEWTQQNGASTFPGSNSPANASDGFVFRHFGSGAARGLALPSTANPGPGQAGMLVIFENING